MRIGDVLFFAPHIRFHELDLDGDALPAQVAQRLVGFYLEPAAECCNRGQAFAAGLLLVSCIDALAGFRLGSPTTNKTFKQFTRESLKSFGDPSIEKRFYEQFRCGLVHEARIKGGGQFSLERAETVSELDGALLINPQRLHDEVRAALDSWVSELEADGAQRTSLSARLKKDFQSELQF